jgi:hypothetical protein
MKMEQTECSETSAYKIQMPGNYPEEKNIQEDALLPLLFNFAFEYAIRVHISFGLC